MEWFILFSMKALKKYWKLAMPLLAVLAVAVLVAVVIRSVRSHKGNNISLWAMLWYEIKFLFSFGKFVPQIEVDQ